jgi:hypothetical protein
MEHIFYVNKLPFFLVIKAYIIGANSLFSYGCHADILLRGRLVSII